MINLAPFSMNGQVLQFKELIFTSALKVAAIDPKFNEKRLTVFLREVLGDQINALEATVQERYFLLLKYLDLHNGSTTLLDIGLDINLYKVINPGQWKVQVDSGNFSVRQLTGREAEFLEQNCNSIQEWCGCMIALQIADSTIPELSRLPTNDLDDPLNMDLFHSRLNYLKNGGLSEFDPLFAILDKINNELFTLVRLSISKEGFVVIRGTDDAPVRFRPSSAFTKLFRYLDQITWSESI